MPNVFRHIQDKHRYWGRLVLFALLALAVSYLTLTYGLPKGLSKQAFLLLVKRRRYQLLLLAAVAISQSLATLTFQSVTQNRLLTPSLLGFEALYQFLNTALLATLGLAPWLHLSGPWLFFGQILVMVSLSVLLFVYFFARKNFDLTSLLLLGAVFGMALRSLTNMLQRFLSPTAFDLLQAKLLGSINNADPTIIRYALPLLAVASVLLFLLARQLDVLLLGEKIATGLGLPTKRVTLLALAAVAILMAVSTALIGSLTFFGFIVSNVTYELVPTYRHTYRFIFAILLGYVFLISAYFLMTHVVHAQGVVALVIESVGSVVFLGILWLRRKEFR